MKWEKNRGDTLSADERAEMEAFRQIDHLLTLVKAKAMRAHRDAPLRDVTRCPPLSKMGGRKAGRSIPEERRDKLLRPYERWPRREDERNPYY